MKNQLKNLEDIAQKNIIEKNILQRAIFWKKMFPSLKIVVFATKHLFEVPRCWINWKTWKILHRKILLRKTSFKEPFSGKRCSHHSKLLFLQLNIFLMFLDAESIEKPGRYCTEKYYWEKHPSKSHFLEKDVPITQNCCFCN